MSRTNGTCCCINAIQHNKLQKGAILDIIHTQLWQLNRFLFVEKLCKDTN